MTIAQVDGGNIRYSCQGNGDPVAMLLPQSSGPVGVQPFLDRLAERFTVIRYDQRGTGGSEPIAGPEGMRMEARAAEVNGLIDSLDIDRARLFCHSTGCGIGIAAATARPDRVAGLVLASPWRHADGHLTVMQNLRVAAARGLDAYQYARFNASLLFPPDYRRAHEEGFDRLACDAASPDADEIEARLNAILAFDTRPLLPQIACPTLIVTGADDQLMPAWHGREMTTEIANARLIELNGGGHMLPETRCAELATAVLAFVGD